MSDTMPARYRRWFEYEKNAHDLVLTSLATVPADQRSSPAYLKAVDLLAHIVGGRRIWLYRFGASPDGPPALFPQGASLEDVAASLRTMQAQWTEYLARLTDAELAREFEYRSLDAGSFRSRVEDILTQLFGHSHYHRGQIATLVRAAGGEPAKTDFVFWSREPV
jgi:uncharacterized damage-inducible protein DinB